MTIGSGAFVIALVVVIALQIAHRVVGAVAAMVWCGAVLYWGLQQLENGHGLHFFGVRSDPNIFIALMAGFFAYNVFIIVRTVRNRRRQTSAPKPGSLG